MSFRTALRNRDFRLLWLAQVVSGVGDRIHEIALLYIVFEVTNDPILVSVTAASSIVPSVALAPVAGSLVDRWNRKLVLVSTMMIRGASVLAIPLVGTGGPLIPVILGVAFIAGTAEAFGSPARNSIIPNLVENDSLDSANGLTRMTSSLLKLLYAAGGIVIALVGTMGAFLIDSATFFVAAVILVGMSTPESDREPSSSEAIFDAQEVFSDSIRGFRIVGGNSVLFSLVILSGLTAFALAPLGVIIPFYTENIAHPTLFNTAQSTAVDFGVLYAMIYLGVFIGGALVGTNSHLTTQHRGKVIIGGVFITGASLGALAIVPGVIGADFATAAMLFTALGFSISVIQIPVNSLAQAKVPDAHRGKVFSLLGIPALLAPPISIAIAGLLIETTGVENVLLMMGGIVFVTGIGLTFTSLRTVTGAEPLNPS